MSEIRFEDPPPSSNGGYGDNTDHRAAAAALRERPGDWAFVKVSGTQSSAGTTARHIRTGYLQAYAPRGSFEAASRTVDGEHRVYARYIGHLTEGTL